MSLIDINGINNYIKAFEEFIFQNFSLISLLTGLLLLINNTLFIKRDLDKKKNVVKNKKFYALNVTGIVLLCVFLISHCISPYLPSSYKNLKPKIKRPGPLSSSPSSPPKPRAPSPPPSPKPKVPSPTPSPKPKVPSPPPSPRRLIENIQLSETASEGERLRLAARENPDIRRKLQLERSTPEEPRQPQKPVSKPLQITNNDFSQINPLIRPPLLQKTLPVPPLVKPKVEQPAASALPKGPRYGPDGKRIFANPVYDLGLGRGRTADVPKLPKK